MRHVAVCWKSDSPCQLPATPLTGPWVSNLVALRTQLVQPLAWAGGFSFTSLLDDVLGCPAGAVACRFVRRRLNGAQFFRRQRAEVEPGELDALLDWRPLSRLQVLIGHTELARELSQRLHGWRSRASRDPRDVRIRN